MSVERGQKNGKRKAGVANGTFAGRPKGYVHIASPATASELRRAFGFTRAHTANVLRAFKEAGVKI